MKRHDEATTEEAMRCKSCASAKSSGISNAVAVELELQHRDAFPGVWC